MPNSMSELIYIIQIYLNLFANVISKETNSDIHNRNVVNIGDFDCACLNLFPSIFLLHFFLKQSTYCGHYIILPILRVTWE